jgi:hypothetical protein
VTGFKYLSHLSKKPYLGLIRGLWGEVKGKSEKGKAKREKRKAHNLRDGRLYICDGQSIDCPDYMPYYIDKIDKHDA